MYPKNETKQFHGNVKQTRITPSCYRVVLGPGEQDPLPPLSPLQ